MSLASPNQSPTLPPEISTSFNRLASPDRCTSSPGTAISVSVE